MIKHTDSFAFTFIINECLSTDNASSDDWIIVNNAMAGMWKEVDIA
jgi:hypothetical protein